MALKSKLKNTEEKPVEIAPASGVVYDVNVLNAREVKNTGDRLSISFDMEVNGVKIYGAFYNEGKKKDGKEYNMISFPSEKAKNGEYYNKVWFPIDEALKENIVEQISNKFE